MYEIKIYNKNKFIGFFSLESLDYKLNKKQQKFKIINFRPLKNNATKFEKEDLYNGVIQEYLNELNELFNNSSGWYKNYRYELNFCKNQKINRDKYEL